MNYNKDFFLKWVMWGTLALFTICVLFLILQVPRIGNSILPIMCVEINTGVIIIGLCSIIIFWYLGLKDGRPGFLTNTVIAFDSDKFKELRQMQYNIAMGQAAGQTSARGVLVEKGNRYLKIWILYIAVILIILIFFCPQPQMLTDYGFWLFPVMIIIILPLIEFEKFYKETALFLKGYNETGSFNSWLDQRSPLTIGSVAVFAALLLVAWGVFLFMIPESSRQGFLISNPAVLIQFLSITPMIGLITLAIIFLLFRLKE